MKKIFLLTCLGVFFFSTSVLATPKQLTCISSDPDSMEKYITRMLKSAEEYRSGKNCSGNRCEMYAKDREAIVEACKKVEVPSTATFVFDTDGLKDSKESGAEHKMEDVCGTRVTEVKATMTHTPSVITFKVWSSLKEKYDFYNVDRKTLQGGFSFAGRYYHACKLTDVDMSENIL